MNETTTLTDFAVRLRGLISGCLEPRAGSGALDDQAGFDRLALELFRLQFECVEPLRRLAVHRGATPDTVCDWRDLPALPTTAFKEYEVTALLPSARRAVFHSSGTTGQRPSRHYHSAESMAVYEAALGPWFAQHLWPEQGSAGGRGCILSLTPASSAVPRSSLAHMAETVIRAFGDPGSRCLGSANEAGEWSLPAAVLREAIEAAGAQPVVLFGTAFALVNLMDAVEAKPGALTLPAGSRIMETGGYKGRSRALSKEELYRGLAQVFRVAPARAICEYGMSELSSQAYDGVAGEAPSELRRRRFRFPPWARAVVVSPETGREVAPGEAGLLRIVDLANVWSALAVQTEDLAVAHADGFELLGRAERAEPRGCSLLAA